MARTTSKQCDDFVEAVFPDYLLDQAIEWINSNLEPGDVFEEDLLEAWAEANGYKRE